MAKLSQTIGQQAENQAKQKLLDSGYQFITSNYSSKFGEIDLIFIDQDQLVFVGVKARKQGSMTHPLESITPRKLEKITLTANYFLQQQPDLPQSARIDAISII